MKDVLPLFKCLVEKHGEVYFATCSHFPGLEGAGRSSEEASNSLAGLVVRFYEAARRAEVNIEL